MANKKTVDPIFAEYARTAPRLDLAFYLVSIGRARNMAKPDRYGPSTPDAIGDMVALYLDLIGPKPGTTASQRRRVFQAIDRYKASRPAWIGAGVPGWLMEPAPEPDGEAWWPTQLSDDQILERALMAVETGRAILANSARRAEPLPIGLAAGDASAAPCTCGSLIGAPHQSGCPHGAPLVEVAAE